MIYNKKRNIILAGIVLLVGVLIGSLTKPAKEVIKYFSKDAPLYLVQEVIDGDTFRIQNGADYGLADGRVRFYNIDAPEKGECYYKEARQALIDLIEGKYVRLIKDVSEKDNYGRWLRYVILPSQTDRDDILVDQYLAKNGFAEYVPSPPDNRYRDLVSSAQWQAYDAKLGMWGACDYKPRNINKRQQNTGAPSEDCIIKGNISEKGFGKIYLVPGCDNYNRVKIDTDRKSTRLNSSHTDISRMPSSA